MRFKAAIFDFDGVVANTETLRIGTYETLFEEVFGIKIQADPAKLIGRGEPANLQTLMEQYGVQAEVKALQDARKSHLDSALKAAELVPSIGRIIRELRSQNIPLIVASNSGRPYIQQILARFSGYEDLEVLDSGKIPRKKPFPDIYLRAIEQLGLCAEDCLAFEDSLPGLQAAKSADLKCVGVLTSLKPAQMNGADFLLEADQPAQETEIIRQFGEQHVND